MIRFKTLKLHSALLTLSAALVLPVTAQAETPICETEISEGHYTASFSIKEYYPGSELHRQTVSITGTPEIVPLEVKSIKTHSGPVIASLALELKHSLQDKALLKAGQWDKLAMTMTLPRISAGTWYHKQCTIETENYILHQNKKIEGDYTNHCDLILQEPQRNILAKDNHLDYAFSGDDHWQPLTLRYDLKELRAFNTKATELSQQQISDFSAGKCTFKPYR